MFLTAAAAALLIALLLYLADRRSVARYRITVEVDTPEGPRTGSSVIEVLSGSEWFASSGHSRRTGLRGEAVAVDLPGGQRLFALLKTDGNEGDFENLVTRSFAEARAGRGDRAGMSISPPPSSSLRTGLPQLVRFADPQDARSIERVDPATLDASFGAGFRLKHVTLEATADPVTTSIASKLPSFEKGSGFDQWYRTLPLGDPRQVTRSHFERR